MSATITTWGASRFLDILFGTRQAPPSSYWVALCTQAPGAQADATMLAEPDPNAGYARALLGNNAMSWNAADTGVITSSAAVVYPVATANWTTVTHYALCDSLVGGNLFLYGSFTTPRLVQNGDVARIPEGLLHLNLASLSAALVSSF